MKLLDLTTGKERWEGAGHKTFDNRVVFLPDGKELIVLAGHRDPVLRRFDVLTGDSLAHRGAHDSVINQVGFLPDGKTLWTHGTDDTLRWWQANSGKHLRDLPDTYGEFTLSPNRHLLGWSHQASFLRVYEAATGRLL